MIVTHVTTKPNIGHYTCTIPWKGEGPNLVNNITQLLFSRNQTGRKLLQAWDRSFYQEFYDTTSYGLQDRIRKLEKLFQGEKGLINKGSQVLSDSLVTHFSLAVTLGMITRGSSVFNVLSENMSFLFVQFIFILLAVWLCSFN